MSLRGRILFTGYLAHDNAERIAELMADVLVGNRYVFVAANEALAYPDVRVNVELDRGVTVRRYGEFDRYVKVDFGDHDYSVAMSTAARTPTDAANLRRDDPDRVYVTVTDLGVEVVLHAGVRMAHGENNRIVWSLAVTGPIPAEVTS